MQKNRYSELILNCHPYPDMYCVFPPEWIPITLTEGWHVVETFRGKTYDIEVPSGFVSDLATTPKVLWGVYPPWGRYVPAAVMHDYMLRETHYSRKICDRMFYKMMKVLGVDRKTRKIMYMGVRIGSKKG